MYYMYKYVYHSPKESEKFHSIIGASLFGALYLRYNIHMKIKKNVYMR